MQLRATVFLLTIFFGTAGISFAQSDTDVVIRQVFYRGDSSTDFIELENTGTGTIDVSNWWICARFSYRQLSSLTLISGDTNLGPGEMVRFRPGFDMNNTSSDLGLYTTPSFGTSSAMVDFVQWGTSADVGRSDVAFAASMWTRSDASTYDFVPTAADGEAVIYDGTNGGGGLLTLSSDFSNGTPLPVELTTFEAVQAPAGIKLRWATQSETNNAGFAIEHRIGRAVFSEVAFVPGAGTTTEAQDYHYTVPTSAPGQHAFRLKQVDWDGQFVYSPVVELVLGLPEAYALGAAYPNPFNPTTQFTLQIRQTQPVRVWVTNLLGQEVAVLHEGPLTADTEHTFRIAAPDLPSGMYFYQATGTYFRSMTRSVLLLK